MSVMVRDLNILLCLVSIQYANFVSMHHVLVLYIISSYKTRSFMAILICFVEFSHLVQVFCHVIECMNE